MKGKISLPELSREMLSVSPALQFTILEIGAIPLGNSTTEPFHQLVREFPGSSIHAFEVDEHECSRLNETAMPGMKYHAQAIGDKHENRPFYITSHPMCSSLYPPNQELISQFNNMEVAYLKEQTSINTITIDEFVAMENIPRIDFIKIDIQGGELDAFRGAQTILPHTLAIITEVEFFSHYKNQPLFGDVHSYLAENGLMFHKFLGMQGRALRPIIMNNNPNHPSWHLWTDAMFVKNLAAWETLDPDELLKLAIISYLYHSPDITFRCLHMFDSSQQTQLHRLLL